MIRPAPEFSFVVVSLNGESTLPACLKAIDGLAGPRGSVETVVVDNGSRDGTPALLDVWRAAGTDRRQVVTLLLNQGFAGGNNHGMAAARGRWIVLLNDDTELDAGWCDAIRAAAARRPDAGVLGSLLIYPDGVTVQHAGGTLTGNNLSGHRGWNDIDAAAYAGDHDCDYVTGACMAIRRDCLEAVGFLDPDFWPIYFEEIDWCRRARAAGFAVVATGARCMHHESRTTVAHSDGFLRKYHRNRLRDVAVNAALESDRGIDGDRWLRAEWAWLRAQWRWLPKGLMARCYLDAAWRLAAWRASAPGRAARLAWRTDGTVPEPVETR